MKISVVIPCYNAEKYIRECIDSILDQSYSDFELICVDDCSTDSTWEILNLYSDKDSRVKCFQLDKNSGSAKFPMDYAISISTTPYICRIDADDYVNKDYLFRMITRLQECDADLVCGKMVVFNNETRNTISIIPKVGFDFNQVISGGKEAMMLTIGRWEIGMNGALVKRKILLNRSTYLNKSVNHPNADEYDSREILLKANRIAFVETDYYYRKHGEAISMKFSHDTVEHLTTNRMLADLFLKEFGRTSVEYGLVMYIWLRSIIGFWRLYIKRKSELDVLVRKKAFRYLKAESAYFSLSDLWKSPISLRRKLLFSLFFPVFNALLTIIRSR